MPNQSDVEAQQKATANPAEKPAGELRGEAKDDDGFEQARSRAKSRLAADDAKRSKQHEIKKTADAQADMLIKSVDIDALAKEVDEDLALAGKFRNLRKLAPDAEKKLKEIRERVQQRRSTMKTPAEAKPAEQKQTPSTGNPGTPQPQADAKAAQGQTPEAPAQGADGPAKPEGQADEITKRLEDLRKEFETKLATQQAEQKKLKDENERLLAAEKKIKEEQRKASAEQAYKQFKSAAEAAGIPDDLQEFAYEQARKLVNESGTKMSYMQIFEGLAKKFPSIVLRKITPQASESQEKEKPQQAEERTFRVRPGTGSPAGGVASRAPKKSNVPVGSDSWEGSRSNLQKRARSM